MGVILSPGTGSVIGGSHAQIPVVDKISQQVLRVYFSNRDENGRSYPVFIEVAIKDPCDVLAIHESPILQRGTPGTFDDSGIMPFCIVNFQGKKYLYYVGWSLSSPVPYHQAVGLAISEDGGESYHKYSDGPVCDRSIEEPYFNTAPFVMLHEGKWKMWYVSCSGWDLVNDRLEPFYRVRYAESEDGVQWHKTGQVCIDYDHFTDAIARPFVTVKDGVFKMFYSFRSARNYRTDPDQSYRIGYAESADGVSWDRKDDEVGITRSDRGWDSEMIGYCCVYEQDDRTYLFYNGNGFGRSGIGYAVLDEEG